MEETIKGIRCSFIGNTKIGKEPEEVSPPTLPGLTEVDLNLCVDQANVLACGKNNWIKLRVRGRGSSHFLELPGGSKVSVTDALYVTAEEKGKKRKKKTHYFLVHWEKVKVEKRANPKFGLAKQKGR